jgi:hypothetical protein
MFWFRVGWKGDHAKGGGEDLVGGDRMFEGTFSARCWRD